MEFQSRILIIYLKHSIICIFNKNTEEYNAKTSENDVKHSNFNMGEMDKSRELYSKVGDNSSQFEGKTVPWEHTIVVVCPPVCLSGSHTLLVVTHSYVS